jgi:hypothetical protein
MQNRITHNNDIRKLISCGVSGLLAVYATTVMAETGFYPQPAQNMAGQYIPEQYKPEKYRGEQPDYSQANRQTNPWTLPQQLVDPQDFQQPQKYYGQAGSAGGRQQQRQVQRGRFVTPEFLESLKQQQKRYQLMPDDRAQRQQQGQQQRHSSRYKPAQPAFGLPGQGGAGYPLFGPGSSNPLYEAPAVSPWGSGADVLYRGESYPLVPNEAIGGFAPMPTSAFGMNNRENNNSVEPPLTDENNVFNPFTFLPNSGLRGP